MSQSISQHAAQVSTVFQEACAASHDAYKYDIEDSLAQFRLWSGSHGAAHPETDSGSLDHRLRSHKDVKERIHDVFTQILDLLNKFVALDGTESKLAPTASDADCFLDDFLYTEEPELSNESSLVKLIDEAVRHLFEVSSLIEKATAMDNFTFEAVFGSNLNDEFDKAHVREKFGHCNAETWLLERLGRAIALRRAHLWYIHEQRNRRDGSSTSDITTEGVLRKDTDASAGGTQKLSAAPQTLTSMTPLSAQQTTSKSGPINPGSTGNSLAVDGDSQSQSTDATSVIDGPSSRVVNLYELANKGKSFECPYCLTRQAFHSQTSWQRHVFADLKAYICSFESCNMRMFAERKDWIQHELKQHRRVWQCRLCNKARFESESPFITHMSQSHEANLPPAIFAVLLKTSSEPLTSIGADQCPLCDWESMMRKASPHLSESERLLVPTQRFMKHLANHLEELASFAIPPNGEEMQGNSEQHIIGSQ